MSGTVCCKRCQGEWVVKSGHIRNKQRWLCKTCGLNFVEGKGRPGPKPDSLEKKSFMKEINVNYVNKVLESEVSFLLADH